MRTAVNASGYVYVADTNNHRIQELTPTGQYVTQWGSSGTGNAQFYYPYGIAVNASGYVYVADTNNNRIQVFTPSGQYVTQWGSYWFRHVQVLLSLWHSSGCGRECVCGRYV